MARKGRSDSQQLDLFVAHLADVPLRDQRDLMAVPCFALGKQKRIKPIRWKGGDDWIEVTAPAQFGIATIWDADVLIWLASQVNAAIERGEETSPRIKAMPYEMLRAMGRGTSGADYTRLRAALTRLRATTVRTSIQAKGRSKTATFGWIERWSEELDGKGRSRGITLDIPTWLWDALVDRRVLAVDPAYFQITSGTARWLYRLVRKSAGNQATGWTFTLKQLHERSGSQQRFSDFARDIRKIVAADKLPEYHVELFKGQRGDQCLYAVRRTLLAGSHPAADRELLRGKRRTRPAGSNRGVRQ